MSEAKGAAAAPIATLAPIAGDERSGSSRNALLCAFIVAAAVLITDPVANMPFIDDFSYAKTALDFARTGHLIYNGWATAMLGWMVPWGALFIKIFGFSFNVVRLSILPIAMASVYLFHQILRRFGLNSRNAVLGSLTMALSPLFLPMAASFMTDVPGLLVILVCIYMCQRAVVAASDREVLLWLCFATLVNVAGGTVRQIAWLGALVMVPSTAWLLREQRGVKTTGALLWVLSLIGVSACLHWFNRQPYSVPEYIIAAPFHAQMLVHLAAQLFKAFLCLLFVVFPVLVAWLATARSVSHNARLRLLGVMVALVLLAIVLYRGGVISGWTMPFLTPLLGLQWNILSDMFGPIPITVTLAMRVVVSFLVIASALILVEQIAGQKRDKLGCSSRQSCSWKELTWILGPFSFSYVILLTPRGIFDHIQDRYLLGLVPAAIVFLLRPYQERISKKLSALSLVVLILFAVCSVGGTHDFFADSRALGTTIQTIQDSGVPRKFIQAGLVTLGWTADGWAQIEDGGYINDARIHIPAGAYHHRTPNFENVQECKDGFSTYTPSITPKYFIVPRLMPCFAKTEYPPVHYTTWLPPFHRTIYVQQLKPEAH